MNSPFPGMNPYLEDPAIWRGFHHGFAEEVRAQLNRKLGPGYYADLEVHTVLEEIGVLASHTVYPDAAVLGIGPTPTPQSKPAVTTAPIVRDLPETCSGQADWTQSYTEGQRYTEIFKRHYP